MFTINVKADIKGLTRTLNDLQKKQIPFATAKALTATAKNIAEAQRKALPSIFDRPTLFTQRSIGVKAARKSNLTAIVFVKDIAAQYLKPFEFGGKHHLPDSKRGGTLMNPKAVQLNQYGNLPKGMLQRLAGRKDVFVGAVQTKAGQTVSGVWQRPAAAQARGRGLNRTGSLRLLVRFGDALSVQPRMQWRKRAEAVKNATLKAEFEKALGEALSTARR